MKLQLGLILLTYPEVLAISVGQLQAGSLGEGASNICPWALHRGSTVSGDASARTETEVFSIRYTLNHGRVLSSASTSARPTVGVCAGEGSEEKRNY